MQHNPLLQRRKRAWLAPSENIIIQNKCRALTEERELFSLSQRSSVHVILQLSWISVLPSCTMKPHNSLSKDFTWGFATAAYQIEGAVNEGGRGKSIWDTFCHLEPSRTKNANGDIACDHYHRFEEDFDLLRNYGAGAYRFSIAWSRIIPLGGREDPINEEGVAFYSRLIDSLLRRGITPWVTLYHWDLPQALHDRYGGWLNVGEIQKDFERYARVCYERFGDRVRHWITLNEPWIQAIYVSLIESSRCIIRQCKITNISLGICNRR